MQQNATAPVLQKVPETAPHVVQTQKTTEQAHDMYKRVLMLAWADGAVSPEEQSQLRDLRTTLRIATEEHIKLELEAKEESYAHAFTLVWTSGMNAKERSAVINELRNKYQISSEAHSRIESKVLVEFGEHQDKPMLYVIDDDENTLGMIVRVLEGGGFTVQAYNTSDEALTGLKNDMPSLIISDINLETSTIGGFSFYEKVRQLHHLSLVPFIFLSGMTDEGMVRYGKGLGADDYLTKPFSGDMLIDTVKGKLKRYKQMKHN
jgi:CheY-like chemotaxis protein